MLLFLSLDFDLSVDLKMLGVCFGVPAEAYLITAKDIFIVDHIFYEFLPSRLTAAVIAASRSCIRLAPMWPERLLKLTRYSLDDLQPAIEFLLR